MNTDAEILNLIVGTIMRARAVSFYVHHPFPKVAQLIIKTSSAQDPSHEESENVVIEYMASAVGEYPRGSPISPITKNAKRDQYI